MAQDEEVHNLEQMLERIGQAVRNKEIITLGEVIEAVGSRSFGPLLLMAGTVSVSPLSGIPGMPTTMGVLVFLIGIQLLVGRRHFWLPGWMLHRSISYHKMLQSLKWLMPGARFIDRWLRPRLTVLVQNGGSYLLATVCVVVSLTMPALELVPFAATSAGLVVATSGLALIARDGLLALFALVFTVVIIGFAVYGLL